MRRAHDRSTDPAGRLDDLAVSRRSSLSLPPSQCRSRPSPTPSSDVRATVANSVYASRPDPRDPTAPTPTDLRSLLAAFALAAVIPAGLFVASRPLVGLLGLAVLLPVVLGATRMAGPFRRFRAGGRLRVGLPDGLRLWVGRHPAEPTGEERHPEG